MHDLAERVPRSMKGKLVAIAGALMVVGAATAGALYWALPVRVSILAGLTRNYVLSRSAPRGTAVTELNAAYKGSAALAQSPAVESVLASTTAADWPTCNLTLTSERYAQLSEINIGGGIITYAANGAQKLAAASGFTHIVWPTKIVTAKVLVLGLDTARGPMRS